VKSVRPEAPLTIVHEGDTYILHTSASVRRRVEPILLTQPRITPSAGFSPIEAVIQNVSDLEIDHKSNLCQVRYFPLIHRKMGFVTRFQVICDDHDSEDSWKAFLNSCDYLSSSSTIPPRKPLELEDEKSQ
jgi:hypothetical protein